jgi:chromosome partitioning protein
MLKSTTTLAIVNNKGGTAKSTTTLGISDALLNKFPSCKILIVDGDEQSCIKTTFAVKIGQAEGGLAAILLEDVNPETVAITVRPRLDVILSGGRAMRDFEKTLSKTPDADQLIRNRFKDVKSYDFIIFDTPPAFSLLTSNIVTFCDFLVIPCTPDLFAYVGVKNTISFLDSVEPYFKKREIPMAKVLGVVPTMYDGRRNMDLDVLDDLHRLFEKSALREGKVFEPIRADIKVKTAQVKRKLLSEFAPTSKATEDYQKLTNEILEIIGYPLTSQRQNNGLNQFLQTNESSLPLQTSV